MSLPSIALVEELKNKDPQTLGRLISVAENYPDYRETLSTSIRSNFPQKTIPVLGITGTGGSGKSSLVDELVRRFIADFEDKSIAIISVDPSKRKTGGALLGDRIRMNSIHHPRVFMRSLATRQSNLALSKYVQDSIDICKAADFDLVIVETSGIGQSDTEITEHSDVSLYVMTAEYGAATQLEKIDMLDFADLIAINKFDKRGSLDALRDVRKQYRRNQNKWDGQDEDLPVYGTMASQFNDPGMNTLYKKIMDAVESKTQAGLNSKFVISQEMSKKKFIIPPDRIRYLAEICESSDSYKDFVRKQSALARQMYQLQGSISVLLAQDSERLEVEFAKTISYEGSNEQVKMLVNLYNQLEGRLTMIARALCRHGQSFRKNTPLQNISLRSVIASLNWTSIRRLSPTFKFLKWPYRNIKTGETFSSGCLMKTYRVPFLMQQGFSLSSGRVKIPPVCLLVKGDRKEQTVASITFPKACQQNACLQPLIR